MGYYCDLLEIFSNIYFSKNENEILDNIKNKFQNNKKLNLNTKFFCSKINLLYLVIHKQYHNIIKLIINYDKKQINKDIVKQSFYKNNYLMNLYIINQYKNTQSNKEEYIKLLLQLLNQSLLFNYHHNFKIIYKEINKIRKKKSQTNRILKKHKKYKMYNSIMKMYIYYPQLCLDFNRNYEYPKKIKQCLNLLYKIDLPDEIIDIICNYYITILFN